MSGSFCGFPNLCAFFAYVISRKQRATQRQKTSEQCFSDETKPTCQNSGPFANFVSSTKPSRHLASFCTHPFNNNANANNRIYLTKFSIVIGSPPTYLSRNRRAITWVSNYRYPICIFVIGYL